MPTEKTTRSQKKDKQDAPEKGGKEKQPGKSAEISQPPSKVQSVSTKETEELKIRPSEFQLIFYMEHFRVSDIVIKVVDNTLFIDAAHKEHADEHGLVSRSMFRKQKLPKDIDFDTFVSAFTSNGFLIIQAALKKKA